MIRAPDGGGQTWDMCQKTGGRGGSALKSCGGRERDKLGSNLGGGWSLRGREQQKYKTMGGEM